MPPAPDIDALIATVDADTASADPLDRLATAAAMAGDLAGLADQLIGHYVDQARSAGASWAEIGAEIGVTKQAAHQRHVARGRPRRDDQFFDRFRLATDHLKLAIEQAQQAAIARGHRFIGTECLLLGVLAVAESTGAVVLRNVGVTADDVVARIDAAGLPRNATDDSLPREFTARAKRAMHHAHRTARRERCRFLGTEHLVIALTGGEGLASDILRELGGSSDRVRAEVYRAWGREG